jgi:hypothetical protein
VRAAPGHAVKASQVIARESRRLNIALALGMLTTCDPKAVDIKAVNIKVANQREFHAYCRDRTF